MQQDRHRLQLRVPPHLQEWIAGQAARNFRSVNQEVVARLEREREQDAQATRPETGGQSAAGQASRA
ncbi:Arc family DNA-binding protein [Roseomonas sp. BN140053]|uniref:Arc family DNA-binding protein n=1 Tax=Roseomonas sp. BN140053 TaxID=3391898 RepID=UPI0039EC0B93